MGDDYYLLSLCADTDSRLRRERSDSSRCLSEKRLHLTTLWPPHSSPMCLSVSLSFSLLLSLPSSFPPSLPHLLSFFFPSFFKKVLNLLIFHVCAAHICCGTCVEVRGFLGLSFRENCPWHGCRGLDSVCQVLSLGTRPYPLNHLSDSKRLLWLAVSHSISQWWVKSFFRSSLLTSKHKDARTRG